MLQEAEGMTQGDFNEAHGIMRELMQEQGRRAKKQRTMDFKKKLEQMLDPCTGMSGGHNWVRGFTRAPPLPEEIPEGGGGIK